LILLSDPNSQPQAMKKLRNHSSAMFVAKCFMEKQTLDNMLKYMPDLQLINEAFVENLLNFGLICEVISRYSTRKQTSDLIAKFAG
jgi:hypothetical protein